MGSELSTQLPDFTSTSGVCSTTQSCRTLQPRGLETARLLCSWDSPGKNTGVGWHFQIQVLLTSKWTYPSISWTVPIRDSTDNPQIPQLFQNQTQCCLHTHTHTHTHTHPPTHTPTHTHTPAPMSPTGGQSPTTCHPAPSPVVLNSFPFPKLLPLSWIPRILPSPLWVGGVFHLTQPPKCLYS